MHPPVDNNGREMVQLYEKGYGKVGWKTIYFGGSSPPPLKNTIFQSNFGGKMPKTTDGVRALETPYETRVMFLCQLSSTRVPSPFPWLACIKFGFRSENFENPNIFATRDWPGALPRS